MTLPIIEQPLYGEILIETSPWSTPFVWTDRTSNLVSGLNYSEGGRVGTPGSSSVDVGTLNATFKNLSTVPVVGNLVRISFSKFAGYAFTGYVQDVSQRIVFDNSVSLTTPITLTTIFCSDWVGYVSQFQAIGAGGFLADGTLITNSDYEWESRVIALNRIIDSSGSTVLIEGVTANDGYNLGDTDFVGSLSEHLDLMTRTNPDSFWYGQHNLPTNKTTGRTHLVRVDDSTTVVSSGKTFTDVSGSAGQLHYTEIDFENSSQNVANTIVVNNASRLHIGDAEVTRIGGFNEENYVVVNKSNVVGILDQTTHARTDATSITTYGIRQADFETNATVSTSTVFNLVINPSMEYDDNGYSGIANAKVRRRQPSQDANSFSAYIGLWAMRARQSTAAASTRITFSGGEADGIPVVAGTTYYVKGYAARGTISRTDMISSMTIEWFNDDEASISTSTTANTTLTTANTWYLVSGSAAAPANAVRATVRMSFARSGGGNISVGDRLWGDAFMLSKSSDSYFDGDVATNNSNIYGWTGGVGASPSFKTTNIVDQLSQQFVNIYSTTSMRATRIRWNAQESLSAIPSLTVGKTISLVYKATTTTYRIIGIDATVDPERYMIDYYLQKV
jgi:hypothetical protein